MEQTAKDISLLKEIYAEARNKYRPRQIRTLILTEAPPCALDRFFYFEDVRKQDSLFLEIMGVLYPREKEAYLSSGRQSVLKAELLERFRDDGFWMLDLCEIPTSIAYGPSYSDVKQLLNNLERTVSPDTPILMVKANVFDLCHDILKTSGYNAINERLPFPGSGQQRVFREKFKRALLLS